jgi:hypothetical protein
MTQIYSAAAFIKPRQSMALGNFRLQRNRPAGHQRSTSRSISVAIYKLHDEFHTLDMERGWPAT